jgi:septal ring factor EnvC (AmiA/AmiB activator)
MQKISVKKPILSDTAVNDTAARLSLKLLPPAPAQSHSLYMTKRDQRRQSSSYLTDPNSTKAIKRISALERPRCSMEIENNDGDEDTPYHKRRRSIRLLNQLISHQQQQYESTMQIAALSKEIHYLTDKLIHTEDKVSKWKKEFKELQTKFCQVLTEHNKTKEELIDTHRMLEESEHIRSRWFIKTGAVEEKQQHQHNAHTLPTPRNKSNIKKSSYR